MTSALQELLKQIDPARTAVGPGQFAARAVPAFEGHFVGWNATTQPCLLIATSDDGFLAPLELSALEVQFCVPCDVLLPEGRPERRRLTVVTCTSDDLELRGYFLYLMQTVLEIVGPQPTLQAVSEAIGKLVEILAQLSRPPRRSLIGLFGEVLIIALSHSPIRCVAAWRSAADDRFDFALDAARLETKATSERVRIHTFSLEQCVPPPGVQAVIASMFVETNGAGLSLQELLEEVEVRLDGDAQARLKLRTVVAHSLGSGLPTGLATRFDDALARSTLQFYPTEAIPAIRTPIPHGVSSLRFRSDLTSIAAETPEDLSQQSGALEAILPARR